VQKTIELLTPASVTWPSTKATQEDSDEAVCPTSWSDNVEEKKRNSAAKGDSALEALETAEGKRTPAFLPRSVSRVRIKIISSFDCDGRILRNLQDLVIFVV